MKGEKQDLRAYVCKEDGTLIIPKEGTSYQQLTNIGLEVIADTDTDYGWFFNNISDSGILYQWYLVRLPKGWDLEQKERGAIEIVDNLNVKRLKISITREKTTQEILYIMTTVYSRFFLETSAEAFYEMNRHRVYLKDRLDSNFKMPICECSTCFDEPCYDCTKNAVKRLSQEFPNCFNPAIWDDTNPLQKIKNEYLKNKKSDS